MLSKLTIPLGAAVVLLGLPVKAQDAAATSVNAGSGWLSYDWLKPTGTGTPEVKFSATAGQNTTDPFAVVSTDSLWQEDYGVTYTRQLVDTLSLNCESNAVMREDDSEELSHGQKVALQFEPLSTLTLSTNLHESEYDGLSPAEATVTDGCGFSAQGHLPFNSVLTFDINTDRTETVAAPWTTTISNAYDAQFSQPLGKLPLTAILKGHYDESSSGGATATNFPSLQQSLVWKPGQSTTVEMGLRQQQYQEYPGISNQFNQALFADWSQKVAGDLSWHSYAEVLNSKGLIDQAPAAPIASGSNGTPQATTPGTNLNPASSLPISLDDQTVTFSTGPSFRLQQDLSASLEYSNRWDKNPAPGGLGEEQRVSVSLKGTF
ncbi:MAG: hypothetical protein LV479_08450 [Methylacidiphilales bacterium]|nr:hypothetical protein [Candidatus Methylacidiphilales bacterium]